MFRSPHAPLVALLLCAAACTSADPAAGGVRIVPEPPADPAGRADWLIDFGSKPIGQEANVTLEVENRGSTPLSLDRLPLVPPFFADPAAGGTVAAHDSIAVKLRFAPLQPGTWETQLPLTLGETTRWIRLRGDAVAPPDGACVLEVPATALDFGHVGERALASRTVTVRNASDYACTAQLRIEGGSGFRVAPTLALRPHETTELAVTLQPEALAAVAATLHVDSPGASTSAVRLTANVVRQCLRGPTQMFFGTVDEGCWSDQAAVALRNVCDHPVRLVRIAVDGAAETAPEFRITSLPVLPARIDAGGSATVSLQYTPLGEAGTADVLVAEDDAGLALDVPLAGDVLPREPVRSTDVQGTRPDADRLYVVDDGADMAIVADALAGWGAAETETLAGLDAHVGITTTSRLPTAGCAGSGADGRLVPVDGSDPRVLDRLELLAGRLGSRLQVPTCSAAPNEAFAAAERAVALATQWDDPDHPEDADGNVALRRTRVPLQVVFVASSDDRSEGTIAAWIERFTALRSEHRLTFAAILADGGCGALPLGHRIDALVRALGGPVYALCGTPRSIPWRATEPGWAWTTRFYLRDGPLDRNHDGAVTEEDDGFTVYVDGQRLPQRTDTGELRYEVVPHLPAVEFAERWAPRERQRLAFEFLPDCPL